MAEGVVKASIRFRRSFAEICSNLAHSSAKMMTLHQASAKLPLMGQGKRDDFRSEMHMGNQKSL